MRDRRIRMCGFAGFDIFESRFSTFSPFSSTYFFFRCHRFVFLPWYFARISDFSWVRNNADLVLFYCVFVFLLDFCGFLVDFSGFCVFLSIYITVSNFWAKSAWNSCPQPTKEKRGANPHTTTPQTTSHPPLPHTHTPRHFFEPTMPPTTPTHTHTPSFF